MKNKRKGTLLLYFLVIIIVVLSILLAWTWIRKGSLHQKPQQIKISTSVTTSVRQTETEASTIPETVPSKSFFSPPPPNRNWPKITTDDGRDNCAIPYTIKNIPLVNRKHLVNWHYVPPIENYNGIQLQPEAIEAYKKMYDAAEADGITFYYRSGYRDFATQVAIRQNYINTDPNGVEGVDRYSAPPGGSEHQTGLAVDVDNGNGLSYEFDQTPAGIWLHANAYKFGFIIRFPKDKEPITGYEYEPWHFRYIGVEAAKDFGPSNKLTLEEYLGAEAAPAPWMIK